MKLPFQDLLKRVPLSLVAAIIVTISFCSSLLPPVLNSCKAISLQIDKSEKDLARFERALEGLRSIPVVEHNLQSRSDSVLLLKWLVEAKGFQLQQVSDVNDGVAPGIGFQIVATAYPSMREMVIFLEQLRTALPIAYQSYELTINQVKVNGKCYVQ